MAKKGHSSKYGVVNAISASAGKCLDYHVMSKSCKGCQTWSKRQDDPNYNEWKNNHNCNINHTKSSGMAPGSSWCSDNFQKVTG